MSKQDLPDKQKALLESSSCTASIVITKGNFLLSRIYIKEIKLYNIIGEVVSTSSPTSTNQSTINVSQLSIGIYFVQITVDSAGSPTGKTIVNRKVVVQ